MTELRSPGMFYGHRLKPATLLLSADGSYSKVGDGNSVASAGIYASLALSQNFSIGFGYQYAQDQILDLWGFVEANQNSFGLDLNIFTNPVGGFLQIYFNPNLYHINLKADGYFTPSSGFQELDESYIQVGLQAGVIAWLNSWLGLKFNALDLSYGIPLGDDATVDEYRNLEFSGLSMNLGFIFLINSAKH